MDGHISQKMLNLIFPDIKYPGNPGHYKWAKYQNTRKRGRTLDQSLRKY